MKQKIIKSKISHFKKDMKDCHYYNQKLIELNTEMIVIETNLYTVQATTFEEKTGSPDAYKTPKLHAIEAHDKLIKEIEKYRKHFAKVSYILSHLTPVIRQSLEMQYIHKIGLRDVATSLRIAHKTLDNRINRELYLYFEELAQER